jgi:hypothetical protein
MAKNSTIVKTNLRSILCLGATTILAASQPQLPAEASGQGFYCDTSSSVPVLRVRSSRGSEAFIRWNTSTAGYSTRRRCQEVAARFERQRARGRLYLTSRHRVNGHPVICATERAGGECDRRNVLITLSRRARHRNALGQLVTFNRGASSRTIELSGDDAEAGTPLELSGGDGEGTPRELSGEAEAGNQSIAAYVTSTEDGDYIDFGRMVNETIDPNASPIQETPEPAENPPI